MYPDKRYAFLVGFKYEKDITDMVTQIVPFANKVFSVGFFNDTVDFVVKSENPEVVAQLFKDHGCNNVEVFESGTVALEEVLKGTDDILVITGSLYLISDMYGSVSSHSSKL
jgi:folylpolyglutamate synthase/dihydropteroate synthase